ncbi:MAG: hypothetical protein UIH27_07235 [Ruminococcus sp.]|nr:hypothetical protein [Ruminococcus sp.]
MENSIKKKINVFGRVGKIITTIIIVFLLVAEGFMLVGAVITAVLPNDCVSVDVAGTAEIHVDTDYFDINEGQIYLNVGDNKIALGGITDEQLKIYNNSPVVMRFDAKTAALHFDLRSAFFILMISMADAAAMVVALFFLRALMKQFMICDTPFSDGVIKKMRAFAISLIPTVAVAFVTDALGSEVLSFFSNAHVDLLTVGFVVVIFILTAIFKYGAQLQKQYDETV